jgi:hypothetical protein
MEHTKIVTPGELEDYADRADSERVIPELISRLVNLSCPDLTLCRIPYDDSVGLAGLDGIVQTESGFRQFVPKQISFWEMGRGERAQDKATNDYRKRTQKTPPEERAKTTFVFVTPRSRDWDEARQTEWRRRRQKDGWREIKVLDGVQLCDWLRESPAVGAWLLQRIGRVKTLTGFRTPAEHWANLEHLNNDDPPLPAKTFLVSRDSGCRELERVFKREQPQLILAIENENDAEDFVAAFIQSRDEPQRRDFSGRCLFVSEPDAWHTFTQLQVPHVLVANPRLDLTETFEQLHVAASRRGHAVIFPVVGAHSLGADTIVPILSPSRTPLETTLVEGGFTRERAAEIASAGSQSLAALKRFLRGLGQIPPYATGERARLLAQASFLGGWMGGNAADREAIEILVGKSYGEWIEAARAERLRPDTPLFQRNDVWRVISRAEAWGALGPRLSNDDLERLQRMALRVLGENDAQFDLPLEERQVAFRRADSLAHSRRLRAALAESLALLGAKSGALTFASHGKAEGTARVIVRKLLERADWKRWASLNDHLPLLAEAAPDEFLEAVEAALVDPETSPFRDLFRQESSGIGGRNYLTGILWGLETLAWHPDYLGRVTLLLGDIAAIDPGGNWGNRAKNSLVDIYLPWHLQTLASLQARRAALEALIREHPDVGWRLLLSLMPTAHSATSGTRKPAWRPFIPRTWTGTLTQREYWEQIQLYAQVCLEVAKTDLGRLTELAERLPSLPEPAHSEVLTYLASPTVTTLPDAERLRIWETLRELAAKHRRFAGADWALRPEHVARIDEIAEKIMPKSFEMSSLRLFTERDWDLYEDDTDFKLEGQKLEQKRQEVVRRILSTDGVEGVVRFALKAEAPQKVGEALGNIESAELDTYFMPSKLTGSDKALTQIVSAFLWRRFWSQSYPWVDQQLSLGWTSDQKLALLLKIPSVPETWRRAEAELGDRQSEYWAKARVNPWGFETDQALVAAQKLASFGQPAAAIDCLYILAHKKAPIPMSLAAAVFQAAVKDEGQQRRLEQHHITEVIKALQQQEPPDSEELFRIEWQFLPLLNRMLGSAEPRTLEHRLASTPAFYCEVIAAVFRSEKYDPDKKREPTELETRVAQNAYALLHGWRILPGYSDAGTFEGEKFTQWLDEVKARCRESGHLRIAMDQLGQALAYAPADPSGLWIHRSVATALDAKDGAEMRRAFCVGLFNSRGVHGFSQGAEERAIAETYREKAQAMATAGFHRLADTVRGVAQDYESDSRREHGRDIFDELN